MSTFFIVCFIFGFGCFLGGAVVNAVKGDAEDDCKRRDAKNQETIDKLHSELVSSRKECELTTAAATRLQTERDAMEAMLDKYRIKTQEMCELEGGKCPTWHAVN
jgi:hypothetical protein